GRGQLARVQETDRANPYDVPAAGTRVVQVTFRRFAQRFLLITGLLLTVYVAYTVAARYVYQSYEKRVFDQALELRPVASAAIPVVSVPRSLLGRIDIPRLNISAIVREGVDERTLDIAAGHIPDTALPGQIGNVGVAAHRDTLFRNLKDVRHGDIITLATLEREGEGESGKKE